MAMNDLRYAPKGELEARKVREDYERKRRKAYHDFVERENKRIQKFLDELAALTHKYGYVIDDDDIIMLDDTLENFNGDTYYPPVGEDLYYDRNSRRYYASWPHGAFEEDPYEASCPRCDGDEDD